LYENPAIIEDRDRSVAALDELFVLYMEHPERMPRAYADEARRGLLYRVVCDYVAGMTDNYLLQQHEKEFGIEKPRAAR
ncbi:MAG: deoxyguanosinetriphosphate triphosphohydrolase, partial [Candidatus Acidiferrales bacterium]